MALVIPQYTLKCRLLLVVGLMVAGERQPTYAQHEDPILKIGNRNQVFIDGRYLQSAQKVRIVACPPRRIERTDLEGDFSGYGTIIPLVGPWKGFRGFDALSKDGIHWRRVTRGNQAESDDLLGVGFDLGGHGACLFSDPKASPEDRYTLFNGGHNRIDVSPDGVNWKPVHRTIFPGMGAAWHGMDSHNICFYDTRLNQYVAYVRVNKGYPCPPERQEYFAKGSKYFGLDRDKYVMRAIGRSVTDDLSRFPEPEVVFESDDQDPHFGGVSVLDFYTPAVEQYPYAQDAYFLFTSSYLHYENWYLNDDLSVFPHSGIAGSCNAGASDIAFAASRDGIHWERYDRKPWIRLEPESELDPRAPELYEKEGAPKPRVAYPFLLMCRGMHFSGSEIWMYYLATYAHHLRKDYGPQAMYRVRLLKDRFTAVEADYEGGVFTTPLLHFEGEALHLNIDTSALGLARVEIQDRNGKPIGGYSLDDCDRIHTTNSVNRTVSWRRGDSNVSPLAGQAIRLRFELQSGVQLHAFQFGPR